jgi:hypothetical protein
MSPEDVIYIDSDISLDLPPTAPPASGSTATETVIKTAKMVRAMFMSPFTAPQYQTEALIGQVTILRGGY